MLRLIAPDFLDAREVMVCGPASFMAAVRAMLAAAEFDMARHHEESFDFATLVGSTLEVESTAPAARTFVGGLQEERPAPVECGAVSFVLGRPRRRPACGCPPPAPRGFAGPARAGSCRGGWR